MGKEVCVFLFLLFICKVRSGEEMQDMIDHLHRTCIAQSGCTDALVQKANTADFPDDPTLKCYIKCLMMELGTLDESGVVDLEAVVTILPDNLKTDDIIGVIKGCGIKSGSDLCDTAWQTQKCWHDGLPEKYMLI